MTAPTAALHHIAVESGDLDNSVRWYEDFFGAEATWSTDRFSALTRGRLPGVARLTEVVAGGLRFHLFERTGGPVSPPAGDGTRFQHVCLVVGSSADLEQWRARWHELRDSGRYTYASAEPPTDIVVDDQGTASFYCLDVNGLEFEFTHVPAEP